MPNTNEKDVSSQKGKTPKKAKYAAMLAALSNLFGQDPPLMMGRPLASASPGRKDRRPLALGSAALLVVLGLGGLAPTSVATAGVASACDAHPDQVDAYTNPPEPGEVDPQPPSPGNPAFLYIQGKSLIVPPKQTLMLSRSTTIKAETIDVWGAILTAPGVGAAGEGGAHLCLVTSKLTIRPGGKIATGDGAKGIHKFSLTPSPAIPGGPGGKMHVVLKPSPNIPHPGMKVEPGGILKTGDGGPGGFHVSPRSAQGAPGGSGGNLHIVLPNTPSTFTVNPGGLVRSGDGGAGGYGVSLIPCEADRYATSLTVQKKASGNCIPIPKLPSCKKVQAAIQADVATPAVCLSRDSDSDCHDGLNLPGFEVGEIMIRMGGQAPQDCPDDPTDPGSPTDPGEPGDKGECEPAGGLTSGIGGAGGDAGVMDFWQEATPSWLVADGSLHIGQGGAGGGGYALGDSLGGSSATGGPAGSSLFSLNGLSALDDLTAASWFSDRSDSFDGGVGGKGGNAWAFPLDYCSLGCYVPWGASATDSSTEPCQDHDLVPAPCDQNPINFPLYCILSFLNDTLPLSLLDGLCMAVSANPCIGEPGKPAQGIGNSAPPGYAGPDGDDAGSGWSGGAGAGCSAPGGPPYCAGSIGASCGFASPAQPGGPGGDGVDASWGQATAEDGKYGMLMGGRGGDAYAQGLNGGPGGPGGKGGDGSNTCYFASKQPAQGGHGGNGGSGGGAIANAGNGGGSWLQGGAGGDATAIAGDGAPGGNGGPGGNGALGDISCGDNGDPHQCHWEQEQGAPGGEGGYGGGTGGADADRGEGGVGAAERRGPDGTAKPVPGKDLSIVRAPEGPHGQKQT